MKPGDIVLIRGSPDIMGKDVRLCYILGARNAPLPLLQYTRGEYNPTSFNPYFADDFRLKKAPNPIAVAEPRMVKGSGTCLTVAVRVLCPTGIEESKMKFLVPTI